MDLAPNRQARLSMKDLTERLGRKNDEDPKRIGRLLQNWIIAGLVKPDGPVHAGPGRYREFSPEELDKAGILYELYLYALPTYRLQNIRQLLDGSLDDPDGVLEGEENAGARHLEEARRLRGGTGILSEARQGIIPWVMVLQLPRNLEGSASLKFIDPREEAVYPWGKTTGMEAMNRKRENRSMILLRVDAILKDL